MTNQILEMYMKAQKKKQKQQQQQQQRPPASGSAVGSGISLCTKGFCFLCLDNTTAPNKKESSLRNICKYLKINVDKLVSDNIKTPAIVERMRLASIGQANIKVSLCGGCERETQRFSNLFQNLEKIRMEIDDSLDRIRGWMGNTEKESKLFHSYQELMSEDMTTLFMMGFIDELKKEILFKCSKTQFSEETSKVTLSRVAQDLVEGLSSGPNQTLKLQKESALETFPEIGSRSADEIVEISDGEQSAADDDHDDEDDDDSSSDFFVPVETTASQNTEGEGGTGRTDENIPEEIDLPPNCVIKNGKRQYTWKKSGGKYKCPHPSCFVRYNGRNSARAHYESIHLNIRYGCPKCKREFTDKRHCNWHAKSCDGTGAQRGAGRKSSGKYYLQETSGKLKCAVPNCHKEFSHRANVYTHYKIAHLEPRFKCDLGCGQEFRYRPSFHSHQQKCDGSTPQELKDRKEQEALQRKKPALPRKVSSRYSSDHATGKVTCLFPNCNREFFSTGSAGSHYRIAHLQIRYKCHRCTAEFKYSSELRQHKKKRICKYQKKVTELPGNDSNLKDEPAPSFPSSPSAADEIAETLSSLKSPPTPPHQVRSSPPPSLPEAEASSGMMKKDKIDLPAAWKTAFNKVFEGFQ